MAQTILMPKQGNTVESCIILEWKKNEGDTIDEGDILCEVETDKATIEVEATAGGTILKLLYGVDEDVPVQVPIAVVGEPGEDISQLLQDSDAAPAEPAEESVPEPAQEPETAPQPQPQSLPAADRDDNAFVSPRARKAAEAAGIDPTTLSGSGAKGRVIEQDVLAAASGRQPLTPAAREQLSGRPGTAPASGSGIGRRVTAGDLTARSAPEAAPAAEDYRDVPVRSIRKITAARMQQSLASTAQLTMDASADARQLLALRKRMKNSTPELGLSQVTVGDMVLFAVARTLKEHPQVNSHFLGDHIRQFNRVNLGFAVDTPKGLMVPVIQDADELSIRELSNRARELAEQCRAGRLAPEDMDGGTSTVTNLGALGIRSFTPVLNTPQTSIFGICSIELKPVEEEGEVKFIPHMGISMTFDHQAMDGAPAARFLKQLTEVIRDIDLLLTLQ